MDAIGGRGLTSREMATACGPVLESTITHSVKSLGHSLARLGLDLLGRLPLADLAFLRLTMRYLICRIDEKHKNNHFWEHE